MNPDLERIARAVDQLVAAHQKGVCDYVNVVALVLTLVVVAYYTYETYKLRREAQRQNELATTPMVMLSRKLDERGNRRLTLMNLGAGAAFNVHIDRIPAEQNVISFQECSALAAGAEEYVILFQTANGKTYLAGDDQFEYLMRKGALPDAVSSVITYESAGGKGYRTDFSLIYDREHDEVVPLYGGEDKAHRIWM